MRLQKSHEGFRIWVGRSLDTRFMMQSRAIDPTALPHELKDYLIKCGLSKKTIEKCTLETRLYHDLCIYGDIAEAFMEALVDLYKVDLSDFAFYKYFPGEFQGNPWLTKFIINCTPWGKWICQRDRTYAPLTLKMILSAMSNGKFG
jgi:hypothetical protein